MQNSELLYFHRFSRLYTLCSRFCRFSSRIFQKHKLEVFNFRHNHCFLCLEWRSVRNLDRKFLRLKNNIRFLTSTRLQTKDFAIFVKQHVFKLIDAMLLFLQKPLKTNKNQNHHLLFVDHLMQKLNLSEIIAFAVRGLNWHTFSTRLEMGTAFASFAWFVCLWWLMSFTHPKWPGRTIWQIRW